MNLGFSGFLRFFKSSHDGDKNGTKCDRPVLEIPDYNKNHLGQAKQKSIKIQIKNVRRLLKEQFIYKDHFQNYHQFHRKLHLVKMPFFRWIR